MADVTHSSSGYTGTVDQVAEAKRFAGAMGAPFVAASATQWAVTAFASANRTVQIASGGAVCCGVRDTTAANATLTVAVNSSGSTRFDVVVATFNWAAGTPVTSFNVITGTTSGIPTINTGGSVVAGQINRIPGVQYDAVLAVVQVPNAAAVLSSANVLDRRPYGGGGGPLSVGGSTFLTAIDMGSGGELIDASTGAHWFYNGTTWTRYPLGTKVFTTLAARNSFFSGAMAPVAGDRCVCLNTQHVYDGTKWRFYLSGTSAGNCDANGFLSFAHGGGQAPVAWTIAPSYQATDALNTIISILGSNLAGDATVLGCRAVRSDTNGYLGINPISVNWTAQF